MTAFGNKISNTPHVRDCILGKSVFSLVRISLDVHVQTFRIYDVHSNFVGNYFVHKEIEHRNTRLWRLCIAKYGSSRLEKQ